MEPRNYSDEGLMRQAAGGGRKSLPIGNDYGKAAGRLFRRSSLGRLALFGEYL